MMDTWTIAAAIWVGVTVIAVFAVAWLVHTFARADARVRKILEDRLARGEIDIEDYRMRIALLGG